MKNALRKERQNKLTSNDVMQKELSIVTRIEKELIHKDSNYKKYKLKHGRLITERHNILKSMRTNKRIGVSLDYLGYKNQTYMFFDKTKDLVMYGNYYNIYISNSSVFIEFKDPIILKDQDEIEFELDHLDRILNRILKKLKTI